MDTEFSKTATLVHISQQHGDLVWMLVCAALVMLMQGGFCLLESGFARAKNSINVAIKNIVDFCVSMLLFWCCGFGLMFGASYAGLIGTDSFLLSASNAPSLVTFFLFQAVFCGTATTIISGALAERTRFSGYLLISVLVSGLLYPVFGHWAWGGFCLALKPAGCRNWASSTLPDQQSCTHWEGGQLSLQRSSLAHGLAVSLEDARRSSATTCRWRHLAH